MTRSTHALRSLAAVLALTFGFLSFATVTTQRQSHAVLPVLTVLPAVGVPFSVVSAGVGGGVSLVSAGAGLAGAAITSAAALASNWAIGLAFDWDTDAPPALGDPPATGGEPSGSVSLQPSSTCRSGHLAPCYTGVIKRPDMAGDEFFRAYFFWSDGTITNVYSFRVGNCPSGTYAGELATTTLSGYGRVGGGSSSTGVVPAAGATVTALKTYLVKCQEPDAPIFPVTGSVVGSSSPTAGTPSVPPGTTPLTVTPRTHWTLPDGTVGSTVGTGCSTTRNTTSGCVLGFPAPPSGATVTGRSAPITRTGDGVQVGDGLSPSPDSGSTPVVTPVPVIPDTWADCQDRTCVMTLTQTDPSGQVSTCGAGNPCASYAQVVKQWPQTGTSAPTLPRVAPDGMSYQCKYGPYAVAVAECQVIPGVGVGTATGTEAGNCLGGVGWNPVTWVEVPVKCALQWAFVPSSATVTAQVDGITQQWNASMPGAYLGAMGGVIGKVGDLGANAAGCGGPTLNLDTGMLKGTYKPLDACPGSLAENAANAVRIILAVGLYLGAAALAARILAASFGLSLGGFGRGNDGEAS